MFLKSISYPHQGCQAAEIATATTADSSSRNESHHHHHHQSRPELRLKQCSNTMAAACYPVSYELSSTTSRTMPVAAIAAVSQQPPASLPPQVEQKDFSRPLHVDCSVEYELPNAAKPPQGVRNEPLLMIHPCYFRKIESQRRSPFINNLPARPATALKRRIIRGQQLPQQVPIQAAPYPVQYQTQERSLWDPQPPPPHTAMAAPNQSYCKRDILSASTANSTYSNNINNNNSSSNNNNSSRDSGHWTDPDCSPDRPEDKHILSGKYRQYLRAHRLHPYIPIASTFPHQIQQVCYNV